VVEDRLEVAVGEPARLRCQTEGSIDRSHADEGGELGRPADLRPDPLGTRRCGEDEPAFGAIAELEERRLFGAGRTRSRMKRRDDYRNVTLEDLRRALGLDH
jgi:hypothetical protein